MSKRASGILASGIALNRDASVPLHRQLYEGLRAAILTGHGAGTRLPSTRTLAAELGISRNTVSEAFAQLLAEGYVEGRPGAGTFVSRELPAHPSGVVHSSVVVENENRQAVPQVSHRARALAAAAADFAKMRSAGEGKIIPFQMAIPDLELFPTGLWGRLVARHGHDMQPWLRGFLPPAGHFPLRQAIARYLGTARGVRCTPEQIFVTGGSQQGLSLACQVLLNPGDTVWMEDPGYRGARAALLGAEANIAPVPVDAEGLSVVAGVSRASHARMAMVTPAHQFPLGLVMSLRRRLDLLEWAHGSDGWILEDDYDSEFRYRGRPLGALQGLDEGQRVLYTGTFSKVLFPALRLGYLVVPLPLVETFSAAAFTVGAPPPILEQLVLTDFLVEGHFERHLRRMRRLYGERQEAVLQAASEHLHGLLQLHPDDVGMHLVGWLPEGVDDRVVAQRASKQGVRALPLSANRMEAGGRGGLLLGYAGFPIPALHTAIRQLASVLATQ